MVNKISFGNDYSEIGHPRLIKAFENDAYEQNGTYGLDVHSENAKELIRQAAGMPEADIHFMSGGTQANLVNIGHILKPYESVIACDTGHISVHETGAIEATGHKVNTVFHSNGKLCADDIEKIVGEHHFEHMVLPRLVYISQTTETGSVYTKAELGAISECCRKNGLYLYVDGARLGSALTCKEADLTLADLASLADIFYIGATKNGGLFGEAVVIINDKLKENYRFSLKQRGALLAKGAVLGIQFEVLFKDGLYMDLARHANEMAEQLVEHLSAQGIPFDTPPQSNQIFPILPLDTVKKLEQDFNFYRWSDKGDGQVVVRLVTSWATRSEDVEQFALKLGL